jgi:hypothetical protein
MSNISDPLHRLFILTKLGIQDDPDKIKRVGIVNNIDSKGELYDFDKKKKFVVEKYCYVDFSLFKEWKDYLSTLKENLYYINYSSFDSLLRVRFRIDFSNKELDYYNKRN